MWDGVCFEVIAIESDDGGEIRYIMTPWEEHHVIRRMDQYDDESEALRLTQYSTIKRQQKRSVAASFSAMFLGHVPSIVQARLENELGISASRMTVMSCIPPVVVFAVIILLSAGARIEARSSPVWFPLLVASVYLLIESVVRFYIAMSQSRGVGSAAGFLLYLAYWLTVLRRSPDRSPFLAERGLGLYTVPPSADVEMRDALDTFEPLLTLLTPEEQRMLAQRYGFDYKRHAFGVTWVILAFASLGALSSVATLIHDPRVTAGLSLLVASVLVIEQIQRLRRLPLGPAGSMMSPLIRLFVKRFLTTAP